MGSLSTISERGISMSQNKVPSTVSSKPHIYYYPTRNVSPRMSPGTSQDAKGISLSIHITQLRYASPGGSYKRKTGIGNVGIPKTNGSGWAGCNPIATQEGRYGD